MNSEEQIKKELGESLEKSIYMQFFETIIPKQSHAVRHTERHNGRISSYPTRCRTTRTNTR